MCGPSPTLGRDLGVGQTYRPVKEFPLPFISLLEPQHLPWVSSARFRGAHSRPAALSLSCNLLPRVIIPPVVPNSALDTGPNCRFFDTSSGFTHHIKHFHYPAFRPKACFPENPHTFGYGALRCHLDFCFIVNVFFLPICFKGSSECSFSECYAQRQNSCLLN